MTSSFALICTSLALLGATPSPQAKAAFERGEKALAAGQFADAERAYREALTATPGYAEAHNGLGSTLFRQNRREEAIQHFRAAVDADRNFALAWLNLGFAARKTNDFATAVQAYETYTRLRPEDPDGFYGLAESYRALGRRAEAIAAYEQYVQREKRPSEQKWVDRAKQNVQDLKGEIAAEEQAAKARAAAAQPQAQAQQQVPTAQPTLAREKIAQGDDAMKRKDYRAASFAYQDAVNADPGNIEALFKLGNSYAVLEYYGQAIERWNRVIELSPDERVKQSARENIQRAQERMAKAGGASPQEAGKPPGSGPVASSTVSEARAAYEEGVKQVRAREYGPGAESLTRAIKLQPNLAVAYVARGSAYIGMRRFSDAAADYEYALKLQPDLSSPLYGLAEAFREMGLTNEARQYYERYAQSTARDVRPDLQQRAREQAAALR